jgi:predicted small secreted protein
MLKNLMLLTLLVSSLSLMACNTMHGFGKDTERAGEHIQNAADDHR